MAKKPKKRGEEGRIERNNVKMTFYSEALL
jgi:hypothetical protein